MHAAEVSTTTAATIRMLMRTHSLYGRTVRLASTIRLNSTVVSGFQEFALSIVRSSVIFAPRPLTTSVGPSLPLLGCAHRTFRTRHEADCYWLLFVAAPLTSPLSQSASVFALRRLFPRHCNAHLLQVVAY